MRKNIVLEGKFARLEEISPKYFSKVIEWRNNPENNRFLNQPFKLTMELEKKWYEDKYLNDMTQGLFIMVDKKNNIPFGTIGWTDYDKNKQLCISGRVLVGEYKYRGRKEFLEATLLYNDYLYYDLNIKIMYAHIFCENKDSISWSKNWGFKLNNSSIEFPKELVVNGKRQNEYIRTLKDYDLVKNKIKKYFDFKKEK